MTSLNGVLPIDKPVGPTSHDMVARARRALGLRRIGHTGTLDPFAFGLLLLCLGPTTRLVEYMSGLPKRYEAVMRLGITTDTDDPTGDVVSEDPWQGVSEEAVRAALLEQLGTIEQVPPLYSAKKVEGRRMYEAARRGESPERKPVRVTIHSIELTRFEPPDAWFVVECSTGTYIRAIARDAGERLGVGAHLRSLRRSAIGWFAVESALQPDELAEPEAVQRALVPPAGALRHLPSLSVEDPVAQALRHGQQVRARPEVPAGEPVALFTAGGELLGVGERTGDWIRPRKVLA
jgi:tRNA pseudouridine55 synthase